MVINRLLINSSIINGWLLTDGWIINGVYNSVSKSNNYNDKIVVTLTCWVISDDLLPLGKSQSVVTLGLKPSGNITLGLTLGTVRQIWYYPPVRLTTYIVCFDNFPRNLVHLICFCQQAKLISSRIVAPVVMIFRDDNNKTDIALVHYTPEELGVCRITVDA